MKMKPCAVPSCQSLKYGLFSFPKNPALILKWLESLNMDSHKAGDKICKEHFNADQYYINKDSCRPFRLIRNSVPFLAKQKVPNDSIAIKIEPQEAFIESQNIIKSKISEHINDEMDPLKEDRIENNLEKTDHHTMNLSEFNNSNDFDTNLQEDNIKNPFKCGNCGLKFSKTKYLREHIRKVHKEQKILSKNYKCQTCGKSFGSPYYLETHVQIHANNMHIKDVHEGQKDYKYNIINPFKCGKCNQKFSKAEELKIHLKTEHEMYNCNECGKTFGQLQMLNQHIKSVHNIGIKHHKNFLKSATNLFKCGKCSQKFSKTEDLKEHLKTEHQNEMFECNECGNVFGLLYLLNQHIKSEHKEINFHKCNDCDKSYTTENSLSLHIIRIHGKSQVLAHKCKMCGKCFCTLQLLNIHFKNVHEVRNSRQTFCFKCQICGKYYSQLNHLNTHVKTVHEQIEHQKDHNIVHMELNSELEEKCENFNDISVKQEIECDPLEIDSQLINDSISDLDIIKCETIDIEETL